MNKYVKRYIKNVPGMLDDKEQQKDRNQWHLAIAKRKALIKELNQHGVRVNNPDQMEIKELEKMLDEAKKSVRPCEEIKGRDAHVAYVDEFQDAGNR